MFTGVIQHLGSVRSHKVSELVVETLNPIPALTIGSSVAVQGACLSVVAQNKNVLTFNLSPETLAVTNLGRLREEDTVHLEWPLKLGDPIDGHLVQGHVDTKARLIKSSQAELQCWALEITIPDRYTSYVVPKGSLALDGVSLTINECSACNISLMLVPITVRKTMLASRMLGWEFNVEFDMFAKLALARSKGSS